MDLIKKTRDDYNKIAKHFAKTRRHSWPEFSEFSAFFKSGQRVLDWGCGSGRLVMFLEGKKVEYFGVDQSIELIKIARRLYAKEVKAGQAHFYSSANKPKKFPKNYFDVACLIASFFHLPDEATRLALLNQIHGELKPGGKLVLIVWNLESDWAKTKAKTDWEKIGPNDFLIPWKNPQGKIEAMRYYHHFTQSELQMLLEESYFRIDKIGYGGRVWSDHKVVRNLIVIASKK